MTTSTESERACYDKGPSRRMNGEGKGPLRRTNKKTKKGPQRQASGERNDVNDWEAGATSREVDEQEGRRQDGIEARLIAMIVEPGRRKESATDRRMSGLHGRQIHGHKSKLRSNCCTNFIFLAPLGFYPVQYGVISFDLRGWVKGNLPQLPSAPLL